MDVRQQRDRGINFVALSKKMAHALRHAPWLYELELDNEGWVPVSELLESLHAERSQWRSLREEDLAELIAHADKQRYEMRDGKIRALYGHSIPGKLAKIEAAPPTILYHGTTPAVLDAIRAHGLKPMRRQYVHLSVDTPTALQVARRRTDRAIILKVRAADAYKQGIKFYRGNDMVWLADYVPPGYFSA
jgi:putative RNA 2'-phosphotransferase